MAQVSKYLAHQKLDVAQATVLPSFLDPSQELSATSVDWSPLAVQSVQPLALDGTHAEAMSLASMAAVELLDVQPTMRVLDVCAAPGMKSLYLKMRQPTADLVSNDLSFDRLKRLERLFAAHDMPAETLKSDARFLSSQLPAASFDRILLDAPCSGEGLIMCGDDKQAEAWSPAKVKRLQQLQVRILKSAWQLLKPGGRLVYSTCTLNLNENERAIRKATGIQVKTQTAPLQLDALPTLKHGQAWRIQPSQNSIGFFIAVLEWPVSYLGD